ncbi:hypothetical protein VNI00_017665 [Paramarasmius palmivorus]|uniref:BAG domain-containing protein n=1 Tax=Paramarasmius palmivorus TaxID=297713 RepID=A0AAW0B6W4_9AGAR
MPRRKTRSKGDIQAANRLKASKYYYRHRETILARHQAHREQAKRKEEVARNVFNLICTSFPTLPAHRFKITKEKTQMRFQRDQAEIGKDATTFLDPLGRLRRLRKKISSETGSSVSSYINNAFHLTMQVRTSGSQSASTPLSRAYDMFMQILSQINRLDDLVLNDHGAGKEHQRVQAFREQVRWIIRCLDDIDMYMLDPDADPQKAYDQGKLAFQDPGNQQFIDGLTGAPKVEYMMGIGRSV